MRVLVVGAGGREHALCWKLRQSPRVAELLCAPGNGGIAALAECIPTAADDLDGIVALAEGRGIDLVVVGPEQPLTLGLVDRLRERGIRAFGPTREAAQLEGSKRFTKELLIEAGIPTAAFAAFTDAECARDYVRRLGAPIVVKADGLAAGKGAVVCATEAEAIETIDRMLVDGEFGAAGAEIVIEEFLAGEEASFLAFTDGETVLPLDSSQDHKPIFDGDRGPNTGGMGAYSPAPVVTSAIASRVVAEVLEPVVAALRRRGIVYQGILYAGLMIAGDDVKVLEFNARFGDPECQALLVRMQGDLVDVCDAVIDGRLAGVTLGWDPRPSVCVVMAAAGYPAAPRQGDAIDGLAEAEGENRFVFHAGTKLEDGEIRTSGGRVLGVTALGDDIRSAATRAYEGVDAIRWTGMQVRRDIAAKAIARSER